MANELVIHSGVKLNGSLGASTSEPLLARTASTGILTLQSGSTDFWKTSGTTTLTDDTTIVLTPEKILEFRSTATDSTQAQLTTYVENTFAEHQLEVRSSQLNDTCGYTFRVNGVDNFTGGIYGVLNSSQLKLDISSGLGMVITDNIFTRGAVYAADYSANYTSRSLIDKGFGDLKYWRTDGDSTLTTSVAVDIGIHELFLQAGVSANAELYIANTIIKTEVTNGGSTSKVEVAGGGEGIWLDAGTLGETLITSGSVLSYRQGTSSSNTGIFQGYHVFTPAATYAGINMGSIASDPSTTVNGDFWYNSTNGSPKFKSNGTSYFPIFTSALSTNRIPFGAGNAPYRLQDSADLTFNDSNNTLTIATGLLHLTNTGGISMSGAAPVANTIIFGSAGTIEATSGNATLNYECGTTTNTSGTTIGHQFLMNSGFNQSSGTVSHVHLYIVPLINTSGTYTGTFRGIYYNPNLVGTTGLTNIAFENVSGQLRFGGVTQDDTKTQMLAKDVSTNQVFWRDVATIGGGTTYSASSTGVTNVSGSTPLDSWHYKRSNTEVTVYGKFSITPTASGTETVARVSLPIASNLSNPKQLVGLGLAYITGTGTIGCTIEGDVTNNEAEVTFHSTGTTAVEFDITFMYSII